MSQTMTNNSSDSNEVKVEIPVWVHGKRKWVTGITKKTTFDDLIYALLVQAEILKPSGLANTSSMNLTGYAIAECLQLSTTSPTTSLTMNECEPPSLMSQRVLKGRGKVIKAYKNWQFDKFPLTVLHLLPANPTMETNSSSTKLRSKIFRRFLSAKSPSISPATSLISSSQSDSSLISMGTSTISTSSRQKSFNDFHENLSTLERQKRLLDCLDEKIHQAELISSPVHPLTKSRVPFHSDGSSTEVTLNDVSRLFSHQIDQEDQLIFATQLCNSILNMQERLEEKTNVLYAVEQAISNELNHVLHQQHYDTLPSPISTTTSTTTNTAETNDLISLKNSIYRSRELSRIQSKEMHDLDLSLREIEIVLASKYDELKTLEYETSSTSRSITPNYLTQQHRIPVEEPTTYDTFDLATPTTHILFTTMKEADEDSGINSLTSDDSNHHSMLLTHQKLSSQTSQLETLV